MYKIFVMVSADNTDLIINAMAEAGAGVIGNYSHCAYITQGFGNWFSKKGSNPTIGAEGKMSREPENKIEMVCSEEKLEAVVGAIRKVHPYETPEIDIMKLEELKP